MMPTEHEKTRREALGFDPKRIQKWFASKGARYAAFDNPAFQRIANDLVASMTAIGGEEHVFEMYLALVKTTALLLTTRMGTEDDEIVALICQDFALTLYDEITTGREAALRDMTRKVARHG